jgi:hypothetical protein
MSYAGGNHWFENNIGRGEGIAYARAKVKAWLSENVATNDSKELSFEITGNNLYIRVESWTQTGKTCEYLFFYFDLRDFSMRVYTQIDQLQ